MINPTVTDTKYKNQPAVRIYEDLANTISLSEQFYNGFNGALSEQDLKIDLRGAFGEILLFSEKFLEISKRNIGGVKNGRPDYLYCENLRKMGIDADILYGNVRKIWNENDYGKFYGHGSIIEEEYYRFSDYAFTLTILNNIGTELVDRYFKEGKPIYSESKWWKLYNITIEAFFRVLPEWIKTAIKK